jgi:membrane protein YdbS with pleckstrin-like domain
MKSNVSYLIKQKSYEKVEYVLRRHPITFLPFIILFLVLCSIPVILYFMITSIYPTLVESEIVYAVSVLLGSVYYLSVLVFTFTHFIDFYLDVWIVTNDRLVDIEQFGLFSRTISELDLFRIQDVTADIHGFFATIFKYGNLTVKTASTNVNIVFHNVPNPNKIRQEILLLANEDYKYHRGQS